jgi:hypothetical protein
VFYRGACSHTAIDWSDPEQASMQAKIDVMREMISHNPMSYSEKDGLVRLGIADQSRRAEETSKAAIQAIKHGKWDI